MVDIRQRYEPRQNGPFWDTMYAASGVAGTEHMNQLFSLPKNTATNSVNTTFWGTAAHTWCYALYLGGG